MLTKKFKKVFWLSLLPMLLLIISITLVVPSIRLESNKDDAGKLITKYFQQQHSFKDLNFIMLTILQGALIAGIIAILIMKIVKERKTLFEHKTREEKMIFTETILAVVFAVVVTTVFIFLSYTFVRWSGEFENFTTQKNLEILDYNKPATQEMISRVESYNDEIKLKMFGGIIAYFIVFGGTLIAKITFVIMEAIKENKNKEVA